MKSKPDPETIIMALPDRLVDNIIQCDCGCWHWRGKWNSGNGYSKVRYEGSPWMVHRLIWTLSIDAIKPGMVLDHLCRNRGCCNPLHLEEVTIKENTIRGEAVLFGK